MTVAPRTGNAEPPTSSEMIPYNCSARCCAEGTSALLFRVRPLHSLQQLKSQRALPCELLEQRALASHRATSTLPPELTPGAAGNLHLLPPRQHRLFVRLGGSLGAGFRPVLHLNL